MPRIVIVIASIAMLWSASASAALKVEITQGIDRAIPIAIVPLQVSGGGLPMDVAQVVETDLEWTGQFKVLPRSQMPERPGRVDAAHLDKWRTVAADYLLVGNAQLEDGVYHIRFAILNVYRQGHSQVFEIDAPANNMRLAAHTIANRVYQEITGIRGIFATRIAYVSASGDADHRKYRLMVSDYDGVNPQQIASSPESIMSPSWSPDGTQIAYVTFDLDAGKSLLQLQDLSTGQVRTISRRRGINGAPAWSPNGHKMLMTLSTEGNPDIYVYDIAEGELRQFTHSSAIDTGAAWSPDGKSIIFTSDRGGSAQLYRKPAAGGDAVRITYEGKSNARAEYTPNGKAIVYVTQVANGFRIATMDLDTREVRVLTPGRLDESPSVAPNGQFIVFTHSSGGQVELATTSINGKVRTRLHQRGDVREPAWSPFGR